MNNHSTSAGTHSKSIQATRTVIRIFKGDENKRAWTHAQAPVWATGAGRLSVGVCVAAMSTLHQRDALVVPVHENRDGNADREVCGHDDQNALDRLPGLVQGGIDHR